MKANQKTLNRNDRAEVGVGTLIVFIAMVLVAAVAAAVLINTSGALQQRASQTGKDATSEVSSNLKVDGIYGARSESGGSLATTIDNLSITLSLQAGAVPIDLSQMIVRYSDGDTVREMNLSKTQTAAVLHASGYDTRYRIDELRDEDNSYTSTSPVVSSGDLVKVTLYNVSLSPRTSVSISLHPEAGAQIPADFTTPATFGTKQNIVLR